MLPEQINEAYELLCDRENLVERLSKLQAAKMLRIEYCIDPNEEVRGYFISAGEFKPTPAIRKLLLDPVQAELAAIDAKLTALGVDLSSLQKEPA